MLLVAELCFCNAAGSTKCYYWYHIVLLVRVPCYGTTSNDSTVFYNWWQYDIMLLRIVPCSLLYVAVSCLVTAGSAMLSY